MRKLLQGNKVKITALREGEEKLLQQWFDDIKFMRNYEVEAAIPRGARGVKDTMDYYNNSNERLIMGLRLVEDDRLIGICGFDNIIWTNATTFLFIGIGDEECRNKGLGKEALNLLIDYGFNEMNFYKLQLHVIEYNKAAIKLYESLGFVREGLYRGYIYRDGRRYHMYLYGLFKNEWNRNK